MNDPKAKPAAQGEPSMEEILASIRRIISEDGEPAKPVTAPAPVTVTAPVAAPAPVVAPSPPVAAASAPAPAPIPPAPVLPMSDVLELTEVVEEPAPAPKPAPVPAPALESGEDSLVSVNVAAAATGSLTSLMSAKRQTERGMSENQMALGNAGATIESIVREEIRPILKAWLDQNLTPMVERMVQREIQRIARNIE